MFGIVSTSEFSVWRMLCSCPLFLVLACFSGCARGVPGETFSAGYIFGEIQSKVVRDFVVKNTTGKHVTIGKVEKSCGCTSFKLGKYQLASGESTTLTMSVDVTKGYMQKSATCILNTDHPKFKKWFYTVQFISLPFVMADPSDLNLGSFTADGNNLSVIQHTTLDLFANSKVDLTRANFKMPDEIELNISSRPEVRQLQHEVWNTRYQVSIGLSPKGRETALHTSQSGPVIKTVQLTAGESGSRHWQYSVYWQTRLPLESHPSYVGFGNLLDEKDDHCRKIAISSTTNEKFRIVSIKSQPQDIRIESSVDTTDETPRHWVTLTALGKSNSQGLSANGARSFLSGTIQVRTTYKRRPIVEIPWTATLDFSDRLRYQTDQPKSFSVPGL